MHTAVSKEFDDCGIDFSGGERQRLEFARVLYKESKIAIFDEPAASFSADQLAPYARLELYRLKGMAVNNEIECGRLIVPEDPMRSTAAMYLNLDLEQGLFL